MKTRCRNSVEFELGRPLRDGEDHIFTARLVEALREDARDRDAWNSRTRVQRMRAVGDRLMRDLPDAALAQEREQTDAMIARRDEIERHIAALQETARQPATPAAAASGNRDVLHVTAADNTRTVILRNPNLADLEKMLTRGIETLNYHRDEAGDLYVWAEGTLDANEIELQLYNNGARLGGKPGTLTFDTIARDGEALMTGRGTSAQVLIDGGRTYHQETGAENIRAEFTDGDHVFAAGEAWVNYTVSDGMVDITEIDTPTIKRARGNISEQAWNRKTELATLNGVRDILQSFLRQADAAEAVVAVDVAEGKGDGYTRDAKAQREFYAELGFALNRGARKEARSARALVRQPRVYFHTRDKDGKTIVQGATRFMEDAAGRITAASMRLTEAANFSTFLHESGHIFLEIVREMAATPNATREVKQMWADIMDWFEIDSDTLPSTPHHELFARTFEAYLRDGKSPSLSLQRIFDTFRKWLTKLYQAVTLQHNLTPEIRNVFDRIFATDAEIAEARAAQGASQPIFANRDEAGMSPQEWASYQQRRADAEAEARAALTATAMDTYYRQQTAWWNRQLASSRREAAREVDADPVRRVMDWIAFGKWRGETARDQRNEDGAGEWGFVDPPADLSPMTLNTAAVIEDYGVNALNALPAQVRPVQTERIEELYAIARRVRSAYNKRTQPRRLASFIVSQGGVMDPGGDVLAILGSHRARPGLINNTNGRSLDDAALNAWEAGYFGTKPGKQTSNEQTAESGRPTVRQFLDALAEDMRGEAVYKVEELDEVWTREADLEWGRWFDQRDIDISAKAADLRAQIAAVVERESASPNAAHPDVIAAAFRNLAQREGRDARALMSGESMIAALAALPQRRQAIEALAHQKVRDEHGDPYEDTAAMEDEAKLAAHRATQARVIELELEALDRATKGNKRAISRAAMKFARDRIENMTVRQIKAYERILGQERKHARLSAEAFQKGDLVTAALEKHAQLVAFHTYAEARDAAKEIEKAENLFRSFNSKYTRGAISNLELDIIDALLEQFELRRVTVQRADARTSLAAYVMQRRAQGMDHMLAVDERLYSDTAVRPFANLTWDRAQGLRDTIRNLAHLGRNDEKMLIERDTARLQDIETQIIEQIDNNGPLDKRVREGFAPNELEKKDDLRRRYHAEHVKLEFLFRLLDGLKDNGPVWRHLFRPLAEAEATELEMGRLAAARLQHIFSVYSSKERGDLFRKTSIITSIGRPMTKAEMMAVALNTGNEYNLKVMMEGYRWNNIQVQQVLDNLDQRDMDVVQAIWDWIGEFKKPRFELHERMTGVRPVSVEATPVRTIHGVYPGGYYPIKYDVNVNEKTFQRDQQVTTLEEFGGNFIRPATKQGALKERQGSGGQTVRLDLAVLQEHMAETIHDLTHREAVIDTLRIVEREGVREAIIRSVGRELYRQIRPWLADVAREPKQPQTVVERELARLRGNASIVAMGWKITTAMVQPLGILGAVPRLGLGPIMAQVGKVFGRAHNMPELRDCVFDRSSMMRHRMDTFDRDVRDALTTLRGKAEGDIVPASTRRTFFWMTGMVDLGVSLTVWMTAYEQARAGKAENIDGGDEAAAVQYADSIVRMTQGSGSVKDQSRMLRQPGFMRLFTMFQTYFSTLYNQLYTEQVPGLAIGRIPFPVFMANMAMLIFLPAVLAALMQGSPDDNETPEEAATRIAFGTLAYPFMGMIGVRDLVQGVASGYGYELSPVGAAGEAFVGVGGDVISGDLSDGTMKQAVLATGYWFGLPARQAWITFDYVKDVGLGEEDPIAEPGAIVSEGLIRDRR